MAKIKRGDIFYNIEIEKIAAKGKALTHIDNLVVFVKEAVVGDIVDIKITKLKKNYLEAIVIKYHKYSDLRIRPACNHFGICGGCKWQNLDYQFQLKYKEQEVIEAFEHIGGISPQYVNHILASEDIFYYRNKLEFTFSIHRWLTKNDPVSDSHPPAFGFHALGKFDKVVDIYQCLLQPEPSNQIRNFVRQLAFERNYEFYNIREHKGFLRNLVIRNNLAGEFMVMLIVAENRMDDIHFILDKIAEKFSQVISLYYLVNKKCNDSYSDLNPIHYKGKKFLTEKLENLVFRIHPKSFFQTNTKQGLELYQIVRKFAALTGRETVYDLYTGTGTIALFIAPYAKRVIGLEYVEEAIEDARQNAQINNIKNADFYVGDIKDILTQDFFDKNGKPDIIILDPPRAGMHKNVVLAIKKAKPSRIVYVSCNPATQARDIAMFLQMYDLKAIQPVDMFPHTYHVENIALLELKK